MHKRNVSIFITDYTIWNSPSLINLIKYLNLKSKLTIFITNTNNKNIEFLRDHQYHFYIIENLFFQMKLRYFFYQARSFLNYIKYTLSNKKYDLNICIDVKGFLQFLKLGNLSAPLIYYSLELQLLDDKDPDGLLTQIKPLQQIEREYLHYIKGVMIQSEVRKNIFFKSYLLKPETPCFILPVTNDGMICKTKSNYLREKYIQIQNQKIVLYIGGVQPYYKVKELVLEFSKLTDYCLFLHGYTESEYVLSIKKIVNENHYKNIIFSEEIFLDINETAKIYQASDIGLAWYEYDSFNFKTAAHSSGKIAGYLRYGLPTLINKDCGGKEVIEKNNCGIAVNHYKDVSEGLDAIFANYECFRENCFAVYLRTYQFNSYKYKLSEFIEQI